MSIKYPGVKVKLVGTDGNAFAIIGAVTRQLRLQGGLTREEVNKEAAELRSSKSYDELLGKVMSLVDVE